MQFVLSVHGIYNFVGVDRLTSRGTKELDNEFVQSSQNCDLVFAFYPGREGGREGWKEGGRDGQRVGEMEGERQ